MTAVKRGILKLFWQTVSISLIRCIIQRQTSRQWWKHSEHIHIWIRMEDWMSFRPHRFRSMYGGFLQMHWIFQSRRSVWSSHGSEAVSGQNSLLSQKFIRHWWHGRRENRQRWFSQEKNLWSHPLRAMRWRFMFVWGQIKTESFRELMSIHFPIQERLGNTDRQQSDFPVTNRFLCTGRRKHSVLPMTWYTRM